MEQRLLGFFLFLTIESVLIFWVICCFQLNFLLDICGIKISGRIKCQVSVVLVLSWLLSCGTEDVSSHHFSLLVTRVSCTKLRTLCEKHPPKATAVQHRKFLFFDRWFDMTHLSDIIKIFSQMCQMCHFKAGAKAVSSRCWSHEKSCLCLLTPSCSLTGWPAVLEGHQCASPPQHQKSHSGFENKQLWAQLPAQEAVWWGTALWGSCEKES